MRYVCIIFCLLVANLHAIAQKSLFKGDWNYFNKDGIYCEVTITDHYIYYYSDSGDAKRQPVRWVGNSLAFGKETWMVKKAGKDVMEIQVNKNGKLTLYRMLDFDNDLVDFYQWSQEKYHNGNGTMMYWRDASERRDSLVVRIHGEVH